MSGNRKRSYASRAGEKLAYALKEFGLSPVNWVCADLGSSTGGFVDCLLKNGAAKVYAVERGYGVIDYLVRSNPRVIVMERTDALHVHLPEPVHLVTIDTSWTRQCHILPIARRLVMSQGHIVTLVKPHYEAAPELLNEGVLPDEHLQPVVQEIRSTLDHLGLGLAGETESPIRGHGGNREWLWHLHHQETR
ncbi:MAG: hypothetical protein MI923_24600 [Phycisphaerales bacterium]|nr:hypothetical protein [Phycisphaerales bacterium]